MKQLACRKPRKRSVKVTTQGTIKFETFANKIIDVYENIFHVKDFADGHGLPTRHRRMRSPVHCGGLVLQPDTTLRQNSLKTDRAP